VVAPRLGVDRSIDHQMHQRIAITNQSPNFNEQFFEMKIRRANGEKGG